MISIKASLRHGINASDIGQRLIIKRSDAEEYIEEYKGDAEE